MSPSGVMTIGSKRSPAWVVLAISTACVLGASTPAAAQEWGWDLFRPASPSPSNPFELEKGYRLVEDTGSSDRAKTPQEAAEADRPPQYPVPRGRLELTYRVNWLVSSKFKLGPNSNAHTVDPRRDLSIPLTPEHGLRGLFEIKFHKDFLVGAYYTHLFLYAPDDRPVHHTGVSVGKERFSRDATAQTKIDLSLAEVFVRYVVRDDDSVKFSFGIGAAWARFRVRIEAREPDGTHKTANEYVDGLFLPTIGYMIQFETFPGLHLFLESMNALISVNRFPAYVSEFRAGFRIPFGNMELLCAFTSHSGQIEDLEDLWGGKANTKDTEWKQASWWTIGGEFGLVWRF